MGMWQSGADLRRLNGNNKAVRSLAKSVPGIKTFVEGVDYDFAEDVLGLDVGPYRITFDYLNHEGEGFSIQVGSAGERLGCKVCNSFQHLLNTVAKIAKLTGPDCRAYLNAKKG